MFVYLCLPLRRSAVQSWENCKQQLVIRVQRKSVLQLAIRASFSLLVLYHQKSFQLATTFLVLPTKTVTWAVIRLFFFFFHFLALLAISVFPYLPENKPAFWQRTIIQRMVSSRKLLQSSWPTRESSDVFSASIKVESTVHICLDADGTWIYGEKKHFSSHRSLQEGYRYARYLNVIDLS